MEATSMTYQEVLLQAGEAMAMCSARTLADITRDMILMV